MSSSFFTSLMAEDLTTSAVEITAETLPDGSTLHIISPAQPPLAA